MKVEDLLKEAMGEQKLSEDARERIVSGALKRVPETVSKPEKQPFYCSPLFRRVSVGLCACIVLVIGLYYISVIRFGETKNADLSAAPMESYAVGEREKDESKSAANAQTLSPVGESAYSKDTVYYKISSDQVMILGNGKTIKAPGTTEYAEPTTESQDFDLLNVVLEPVRKYVEDLKEPAPYVLIEVSEEDGVVKAVLEPATTSVLNEYKLDADAFDGSLSLAPQQQEEKGEENRGTLTVYLEKDPETGSYRVVSAISDPYIGK